MYILLTIICLASIAHTYRLRTVSFFDEANYNPCGTKVGLYFYAHPVDPSKYYQCDETGNAYIRSCGDLVWDELHVACNWPSTESVTTTTFRPPINPTPVPWPIIPSQPSFVTFPTSAPFRQGITLLPTPPTFFTFTTTTTTTTTTPEPILTTSTPSSSLCEPINPCGEHGTCIESTTGTFPTAPRRFGCVCSENWFGRFCDRHIDELTTPAPRLMDQNEKFTETMKIFSQFKKIQDHSKLKFYGFKPIKNIPIHSETSHN